MTLLASWPTLVDDSGDGSSGTVLDKSVFDDIKASVEDNVHSTTNSGIKTKTIIDEVVDARGNMSDLDARISGVIDDDGNLITPASLVSQSQLQAQMGSSINFYKNSTYFLWSGGKTAAPDYHTLSNGTITITGASETDAERKVGEKALKLTWSSGTAELSQTCINATDFAKLDHLQGRKVGFGIWMKTSIANHLRIQIDDGVDTTESSYHTGGGDWEFVGSVHTLNGSATKLEVVLQNAQSGSGYFSGGVVCLSDFAPLAHYPEPTIRGAAIVKVAGTLSTGDGKDYVFFARPVRIDRLQAIVTTDPTGDDIDIDFEKFEPTTTWTSMVTAGALIDAGDGVGQLDTTGDYDHRCLGGMHTASGELAATGQEGKLARLNIDTVGSTIAGAGLTVRIDGVQCLHPFEDNLSPGFLGV